ncbi:MAG: esterase/lipase superfamily enzyme [Phycisphaerales bacterium]|jgi:esterase/lipase superfamily enzyme
MPKHWIITNRRVQPDARTGHDVDEGRQSDRLDGLPTFRVATLQTRTLGDTPTDDELKDAVRFVPDAFIDDYRETLRGGKPKQGTAHLFRELYDSMKAEVRRCEADGTTATRKGDALVFIHGFNYNWADSLKHLHRLTRVYADAAPSPVSHIVYLSWPSWGRQLAYKNDQEIALQAGIAFGRLFAKVVRFYRDAFGADPDDRRRAPAEFCGARVHLAAHSMGNQVLEQFMRTFEDVGRLRTPVFGEALLLHADADWTALEPGRPMHTLPAFADRVHVYNHTSDDALRISEHLKNDARRLGRHGPRSISPGVLSDRTLVVDCSDLKGEPGGKNDRDAKDARVLLNAATESTPSQAAKDYYSVAKSVLPSKVGQRERIFDHWGYLHRPEEVADIWQVLRGVSSSKIPGRESRSGPIYRLLPG